MTETMKDAFQRMEKQNNFNVSWNMVQVILPIRNAKEHYTSSNKLQVHIHCHNCSMFHEQTQLRREVALWASCPVTPKLIYTSQRDQKSLHIFLGSILIFLAVWYERKRKKEGEKKSRGKERKSHLCDFSKIPWEHFNFRGEKFNFIWVIRESINFIMLFFTLE